MSHIYIQSNESLAEVAEQWLLLERIALDSEFMRVDTFYPILALIQINDGHQSFLIDPTKIDQWQPLVDVFSCESVLKVLHSPSEDLDVFFNSLGVLPRPIFDTQLAACMASLGGIMGYQKLVKNLLDVDLEKGETRSDWLKRPLTDSQIHYAVEDVNHLLPMTDMLTQKLRELGRLEWLQEDCNRVLDDWLNNQRQGYSHERIKKAWTLKSHQLNVLSQLVIWRETRCKEVNKPRGHLVKDDILMDIALRLPQSISQLSHIKGLRHATLKKEGKMIIDLIQSCKDMDKDQWPSPLARPLSQAAGEWFKKMRKLVNELAEEMNLPPEILARKKPLEKMLRDGYSTGPYEIPDAWQGWRQTVVAQPLVQLLNQLSR